jgi:hypothetical protein
MKTKEPKSLLVIFVGLLVGLLNLTAMAMGVILLAWSFFMTPEYPGHEHNMQIIAGIMILFADKT